MLPPLGSMAVASGEDQAALALFFFTGVLISLVVEALHVGLVDLIMERETAQVAVRDRELLLNELAHRTRNDFANIVTLLNLQSRSAGEDAREALLSAADRVQTIARVHRQLELRDDHVVVDTKSYIGELCADLRLSRLAMRPVAIECNAESHSISLEKAVPLGLIINKSITNAAKHAFPDERQGIIKVTFERAGDVYKLTVADNGIGQSGKPRDGGLGNRLVQMLAAQLDSKVEVEPRTTGNGGCRHASSSRPPEPTPRVSRVLLWEGPLNPVDPAVADGLIRMRACARLSIYSFIFLIIGGAIRPWRSDCGGRHGRCLELAKQGRLGR